MTTAADGIERSDVARIDAFLDDHFEELVAFRRSLHTHPELSWHEFETTERIAERLRVAGLEPRVLSTGTGLVCDVGDGDGPVVALRGDIDALAMDDETDRPWRSQVPGVAHACGHDVHTAVTLGAGLAWSRAFRDRGRLRLVFEPAEETVPGGARQVIAEGGIDGVSAMFGLHCYPALDVGYVGLRSGPMSAAADMCALRITGPGGHTARPSETVDLVRLAGRIAVELGDRAQAGAGDLGSLLVVFGALHSGQAANVIPTSATMHASVRTPDDPVWEQAEEIVGKALSKILDGTGATWEMDYTSGAPPVVCDPALTAATRDALAATIGTDRIVEAPRSTGGDTFAWFAREVPSCFIRLGTHDPADLGPRRDLHAGTFDVDERAIAVGVRTMLASVLAASAAHRR